MEWSHLNNLIFMTAITRLLGGSLKNSSFTLLSVFICIFSENKLTQLSFPKFSETLSDSLTKHSHNISNKTHVSSCWMIILFPTIKTQLLSHFFQNNNNNHYNFPVSVVSFNTNYKYEF